MAERTVTTKMVIEGAEEYISTMEKITAALRAASQAKKEFDALFNKASNSTDNYTSSSCALQ